MKRLLPLILLLALTLSGCYLLREDQQNLVTFYYRQADLSYGSEDGVTAPENRELAGYRDNLRYLLTLYFHGPQDPALSSPFPAGTAVTDVRTEGETLVISLNSAFAQLKDMDLTIACTCLARTCFGLTDAQHILIESSAPTEGSAVHVSLDRDDYLLADSIPETNPTE